MSASGRSSRQIIGWREWAALPDLGVDIMDAKIDTGAKGSAIGAFNARRVQAKDRQLVEFGLQLDGEKGRRNVICRAPYLGTRIIRSSNGQEEKRMMIETRIGLGDRLWKIELSLTNRDAMEFQLLLGRNALGRKFLVNPAAAYLMGR